MHWFCPLLQLKWVSNSEGEGGNDEDKRDLFNETVIEEYPRSLDKQRQCEVASEHQEMTEMHAEVNDHIDEVKIIVFF